MSEINNETNNEILQLREDVDTLMQKNVLLEVIIRNINYTLKTYMESNLLLTRRITKAEEQLLNQNNELNNNSTLIFNLRNALQMCNPDNMDLKCKFCNGFEHTKDCEYVKLAGG